MHAPTVREVPTVPTVHEAPTVPVIHAMGVLCCFALLLFV